MIIFNYSEHCDILERKGFEKFSNIRDLMILAQGKLEKGIDKEKIREELLDFCKEKDKNFNLLRENKKIDCVLQKNNKRLRELKEVVYFTQNEIDFLKSLGNYDEQKFLFVLMVLCKAYSMDSVYLNSKSPVKIKDILEVAKINCSVGKGEMILHELYAKKALSVLPNLKYTISNLDLANEESGFLKVKPSVNCIEDYEVFCGKGIFCQTCGTFVRKRSNNTKYCPTCAKENKKQQDIVRIRNLSKVEK